MAHPATAQDFGDDTYAEPSELYGIADIGFALAIPSGDFRDQTDNIGFGINGAIGVGSRTLPFVVGIEGGFFLLDSNTENVPLSTTVFGVNVDVETTNNLAQGHVFLRLQPSSGMFRPYAEALIGAKYLFTETSVQSELRRDGDEDVFSSTNFDDWSFSYGAGAGVAIELYRETDPTSDLGTVSLLIGAKWTAGSTAEYLDAATIQDRNGNGVFDREDVDVSRSRTDVVVPMLGVSFTF
jgi:hypothetical protein